MSAPLLDEVTLESPAGIYALESNSGTLYVLTVPHDAVEPGEVFMRRHDGVTSNVLRVFQARFTLNREGIFYMDEGEGVKLVHTPVIVAMRLLKEHREAQAL